MATNVMLTLSSDEALLLSDMLHRFEETLTQTFEPTALPIRDVAERLALLRLHGAFERNLVELFAPDYEDLVRAARERLTLRSERIEVVISAATRSR